MSLFRQMRDFAVVQRDAMTTLIDALAPFVGSALPIEPSAPLALPPARKTKRRTIKRKPTRKVGRPRKATAAPVVVAAPVASTADPLLATRRCRQCLKLGTAQRVSGSDRTVKCSACGANWAIRLKPDEQRAAPSVIAKARGIRDPSPEPDHCRRCDHDKSAHTETRCLVPRCVCSGFYE